MYVCMYIYIYIHTYIYIWYKPGQIGTYKTTIYVYLVTTFYIYMYNTKKLYTNLPCSFHMRACPSYEPVASKLPSLFQSRVVTSFACSSYMN